MKKKKVEMDDINFDFGNPNIDPKEYIAFVVIAISLIISVSFPITILSLISFAVLDIIFEEGIGKLLKKTFKY